MMGYMELEELEERYAKGELGSGLTVCLQVAKMERDKELKQRNEMLLAQYDRLRTKYNRILRIIRDFRIPDDETMEEVETYLKRLKKNNERITELKNINL